ncbi:putative membrane protein [Cellvibrio japonicus Ueda107]|uniref:Putative membrane protein n=2 Tax=Cellvibrio japonicus TaxID=155077 RepID=B3PHU9_CELJU|nr:putative membrane protein [Cellvibrio japonicus Ueda107]
MGSVSCHKKYTWISGYIILLRKIRMNFYWVYDLPNGLFGLLTITFFVGFAVIGLIVHRRFVLRIYGRHPHNDLVSYYLAAVGVFYGITLGLISVGTYTTFTEIESTVSKEANTLGAIYVDVGSYPEPVRTQMRQQLSEFTHITIEHIWPIQRKGEIDDRGLHMLRQFNETLNHFEPSSMREGIIHAEVLRQFNQLLELHDERLQSVGNGMPITMYVVIVVGALLNIMVSWLFIVDNLRLHNSLNVLTAALLGLLVFLIAAMDHPFRGEYSIGPDAFEFVRDKVINSSS